MLTFAVLVGNKTGVFVCAFVDEAVRYFAQGKPISSLYSDADTLAVVDARATRQAILELLSQLLNGTYVTAS